MLAVVQELRLAVVFAWALGCFFTLCGAAVPGEMLVSLITATLFGLLLLMLGMACSLTAQRPLQALAPTLGLPILLLAVLPIFWGPYEVIAPRTVWGASCVALLAAAIWYRRSATPGAVGCYFMSVYWVSASLLTFWADATFEDFDGGFALLASYPPYWIASINMDYCISWCPYLGEWTMASLCYWLATLLTLLWAWHWMIADFDRLAGRVSSSSVYGGKGDGDNQDTGFGGARLHDGLVRQ